MTKRGLSIGVVVALSTVLITALYNLGYLPSIIQVAEFLGVLVGSFVAGLLAARDTGRVRSGTGAGAIASALPGLVIVGASVIRAVTTPAAFAKSFGYHDVTNNELVIAAVVQSLLGLTLWVAIGIGLGAIGGLVGRRRVVRDAAISTSTI